MFTPAYAQYDTFPMKRRFAEKTDYSAALLRDFCAGTANATTNPPPPPFYAVLTNEEWMLEADQWLARAFSNHPDVYAEFGEFQTAIMVWRFTSAWAGDWCLKHLPMGRDESAEKLAAYTDAASKAGRLYKLEAKAADIQQSLENYDQYAELELQKLKAELQATKLKKCQRLEELRTAQEAAAAVVAKAMHEAAWAQEATAAVVEKAKREAAWA
jgi:hypothetical protein